MLQYAKQHFSQVNTASEVISFCRHPFSNFHLFPSEMNFIMQSLSDWNYSHISFPNLLADCRKGCRQEDGFSAATAKKLPAVSFHIGFPHGLLSVVKFWRMALDFFCLFLSCSLDSTYTSPASTKKVSGCCSTEGILNSLCRPPSS